MDVGVDAYYYFVAGGKEAEEADKAYRRIASDLLRAVNPICIYTYLDV